MKSWHELAEGFRKHHDRTPRIFRAPGRVNLIGEHTDYNDGFGMPAAIDFNTWVAAAPRADRKLTAYSENLKESAEFDLDSNSPRLGRWGDYVFGVAFVLERAGYKLCGADLIIYGNIPLG